jgi:predicted PurR-regulated permease PerM
MDNLTKYVNQTPSVRFVILTAGAIIILTAIYAASTFLVPILLALIFAVLFWVPLDALQKRGMSSGAALGIVLLGFFVVSIIFLLIIAVGIAGFAEQIPVYQERLTEQLRAVGDMLRGWGMQPPDLRSLSEQGTINIGTILGYVISGVGQLFSYGFIIFFYVIFMLVEATTFQGKIKTAFKTNQNAYGYFAQVMNSLQYYLVIKTRINVITGLFIGFALWLIGLDFAILWGFLAFWLNYIPNFGSIIAAIPAVILAFVQFGPGWELLLVIGIYLGVNLVVGYWLEPKMMGKGLGLSALVVLIAVIFWGWILGPVGLILSVPITVALKIFMLSYPGSYWAAIMLGDKEDITEELGQLAAGQN